MYLPTAPNQLWSKLFLLQLLSQYLEGILERFAPSTRQVSLVVATWCHWLLGVCGHCTQDGRWPLLGSVGFCPHSHRSGCVVRIQESDLMPLSCIKETKIFTVRVHWCTLCSTDPKTWNIQMQSKYYRHIVLYSSRSADLVYNKPITAV